MPLDGVHYMLDRAHHPKQASYCTQLFPRFTSLNPSIIAICSLNYPSSTLHSQWFSTMFVLPQLGLKVKRWHKSLKNKFLNLNFLPHLVHIQVHLLTKNHSKILNITTSSKLFETSKIQFRFKRNSQVKYYASMQLEIVQQGKFACWYLSLCSISVIIIKNMAPTI